MSDKKKLLHERLRECAEHGRWDVCYICEEALGLKCYEHSCDGWITRMADEIERCYIPRPRFEDGEPVQFGCDDLVWIDTDGDDPQAPWRCTAVNKDGVPMATSYGVVVSYAEMTEDGFVRRRTHDVFDADGVPIKIGDTVYTEDGEEGVVTVIYNDCSLVKVGIDDILFDSEPGRLTHEYHDSIEKLLNDISECRNEHVLPGSDIDKALCGLIDRIIALTEKGA